MIYDSLKNKNNYKDFSLLYQALCFLEDTSRETLLSSDIVLIKKQLYCTPVSLISKPENECIYEAHKKYIDLHYIISGVERIATSDVSNLSIYTSYDSDHDIEFFEGASDGYYDLQPGQFMVCFPSDAHKVAIMKDKPCSIQKVVFKIRTEE